MPSLSDAGIYIYNGCQTHVHLAISTVILANAAVAAFVPLCNSSFNFTLMHSVKQRLLRNWPWSGSCDLLWLLPQKIAKGIHSCKPASLNRPIAEPLFLFSVTNTEGKALELHSAPSTSSDPDPKDPKDKDKEKEKEREKEKDREKEVKKEKEESVPEEESQLSPAEQEQLRSLKEICRKVRLLPPALPSICFYTFINAHQGWEWKTESIFFFSNFWYCVHLVKWYKENLSINLFPQPPSYYVWT